MKLEISQLQKIPITTQCFNVSQELAEQTANKFRLIEDSLDANYTGYLGENAVKQYLGLPFSEYIPYGGDGSIDAIYNNLRINIKCKFLPKKYTFLWDNYKYAIKADMESKSDIFLLTLRPENKNYILIYGIVFKNDMLRYPQTLFTNKRGEQGNVWDIALKDVKFIGKNIEYILTHIIK